MAVMSLSNMDLLYGRSKLSFQPPSDAKITVSTVCIRVKRAGWSFNLEFDCSVQRQVFDKSAMPSLENPQEEVDVALDNPVGCAPIDEIAR